MAEAPASNPAQRGPTGILAMRPSLVQHSRHCALAATRALGAVSYTHLRAHETKANLVCRLLLEKKKKKKIKKLYDVTDNLQT